jgi:hypothetical protein
MAEYRIIARFTSTDPRDAGASNDRVLGRSDDGEGLRVLARRLTIAAKAARAAFHAGPSDRSFEDRHASMEPYEKKVSEWFDVSLKGDAVSFHVQETREIPVVDLSRLDRTFGDEEGIV